MPTKDTNIIKYNQGEKPIKLPFVVYADLECLLDNGRNSGRKSDIVRLKVVIVRSKI